MKKKGGLRSYKLHFSKRSSPNHLHHLIVISLHSQIPDLTDRVLIYTQREREMGDSESI